MKKQLILLTLSITSFFTLPAFSEEVNADQAVMYNQLLNQMKGTSPEDLAKVDSDADLAVLMDVMKMVQNKNYKESITVLENLLKNPKGKSITPQSKDMIKNLIEVMKVMDSGLDM